MNFHGVSLGHPHEILLKQHNGKVRLLLTQGHRAKDLLRRVVSRRRGRCELGLVSAIVSLLQRDKTLYNDLCPHVKLKLEATLENVS